MKDPQTEGSSIFFTVFISEICRLVCLHDLMGKTYIHIFIIPISWGQKHTGWHTFEMSYIYVSGKMQAKKSLIGCITRDLGARSQRNLVFLEGGDGSKGVKILKKKQSQILIQVLTYDHGHP